MTNQPKPLYTDAVCGGGLVFTSGQIPGNPDGSVPIDMAEQVHQVFDGLDKALSTQGCTISDVLTVTVYLLDIEGDFEVYNAVYRERMLPFATPARTTVQVAKFRGQKRIELQAVAKQRS